MFLIVFTFLETKTLQNMEKIEVEQFIRKIFYDRNKENNLRGPHLNRLTPVFSPAYCKKISSCARIVSAERLPCGGDTCLNR